MFGVLDAIAGGQADAVQNNSHSTNTNTVSLQNFDTFNQGASGLENASYNGQMDMFKQLTSMVGQGPGASAVTDANNAGNQLSALLTQFMNNSGLPTSAQNAASQSFAQSMFAPQQVALQQSFIQQNQAGARAAASMGRSGADPVLLNKLGVAQTQQQQLLNSQQGAFAAQTAQAMPGQQMNIANSLFNVKQGLASQAFNNRNTLLQMGNQLASSERNYRLQTATRTGNTDSTSRTESGGGFKGQVAGFQAGTGAEMGMFGKVMGGMMGGG